MAKHLKQAVSGIIFCSERQKVLLIKRRDIPVWVLPGGGVEEQETPEEAVVREVYEETGLSVQIVRKVAEYSPVNKLTQLTHLFECSIVQGNLQTGSETKEIGFFLSSKPNLLPPPYLSWIQDASSHQKCVIQKKVEGVSYLVLCKFLCLHPILVTRYLLTKIGIHINT
ncbi:RNA pyrophosphohydrolase [Candidatus Rhabdochlamydia oedothoracis]|uniref:RNA pyrophosphohydrolase n=1 Tax=Candidatus Rhabdochlamydia oedothoracis TaxID=2720720 RepID=A0ABX8V5C8_9BACT|nr:MULTISPECIES: NUDIX domain-containing protein [Rhabdochlamydia]KAG6559359.1 RNA pyrophosphohydrolase [Candidatus Rhabdochlamydia sp. W815]MCL6756055.1 NUDIX domain-containing protein [Candidatus Rhabdochlamydia oedothoracis]QYF48650.1 RNA pyrophosphohydrolase [Candidatus Rhabdochlamydia oedothoracis]